ncbi:MAG: glycosyltransferase [Bacteroidetes bacterium]|nr:glycosyltransferase [Bacteroidota bacterium]
MATQRKYRYKPVIVVAAYNRPQPLLRLLNSLVRARYPEPVKLIISVDRNLENDEIFQLATHFAWQHGEKEVIYREERMGLRDHILTCGDLTLEYESIILLEDDLMVAPSFYEYALEAVNYYADDDQIEGIALYSIEVNMFARYLPFRPINDGADVFFSQFPCSWGQVWTKDRWVKFRDWYLKGQGVSTEDLFPSDISEWPATSWLKYYIKYAVEHNYFFVYPRISLSTNFGEYGVHFQKQIDTYQVPTLVGRKDFHFIPLEESLSVYDTYFEILPDRLNRLVPEFRNYDYIVNLYGRKNPADFEEKYVLSRTPSNEPIFSFGMKMRPILLNVINRLEGNSVIFSHKDQLMAKVTLRKLLLQAFEYNYSHLPLRPLLVLLRARMKERKPFSLLFRS